MCLPRCVAQLNSIDAAVRVTRALESSSRQTSPFPNILSLEAILDELGGWLEDDRQWGHANPSGWISLVRDFQASIGRLPSQTLECCGEPRAIRDGLAVASREIAEKSLRREVLLRRRLMTLRASLENGLRTESARDATWQHLLASETSSEAEATARVLRELVQLAGRDVGTVLRSVTFALSGNAIASPEAANAALIEAQSIIVASPRLGDIAVWLRLLHAPLPEGVLAIGPDITVYDASYLAPQFGGSGPTAHQEVSADDGTLAFFCWAEAITQPGSDPDRDFDLAPWALVRILIRNATMPRALASARRTAATLGALGTLYGASPSVWQVDNSYVTFRDGKRAQAQTSAPLRMRATAEERIAITRDPTARLLKHSAEDLSCLLPIGDGQPARVAELMLWSRDARSSPPPTRLTLFDRAIETVSGWAGVASPRRFVEVHLIPSWARRQMLGEVRAVAIELVYNDARQHYPEEDPDGQAYQRLLHDTQVPIRAVTEGDQSAFASLLRNLDRVMSVEVV
jgi:hypothetical protein